MQFLIPTYTLRTYRHTYVSVSVCEFSKPLYFHSPTHSLTLVCHLLASIFAWIKALNIHFILRMFLEVWVCVWALGRIVAALVHSEIVFAFTFILCSNLFCFFLYSYFTQKLVTRTKRIMWLLASPPCPLQFS